MKGGYDMKRFLAFIIAVAVVFSICGTVAFAAEKRAAFFCPRCGGTGYTTWSQEEGAHFYDSCDYYDGEHSHVTFCTVDTATCEDCQHYWVVKSVITSIWCNGIDRKIYSNLTGWL